MDTSSQVRVYIAGPMSGLPDLNYPAFNDAATILRAQGFHVENPAENTKQDSWENYMRLALRQVVTCHAVCLLPGHETSRGARLEKQVAEALRMDVRVAADWGIFETERLLA